MRLGVQAAGKTDVGLVRSNNEDNFGFDLRSGIFVVCDGMGGQAAGELASKVAVDTILAHFQKQSGGTTAPVFGRNFEGVSERANAIASAIQLANVAIRAAGSKSPDRAGLGSTVIILSTDGQLFSIGHVGDSRIYLVRGGTIQPLTSDHSLVMEQVRRGLMSAEEAEQSDMQSVIVRALGSDETVEPDLADHQFVAGDVALLCSDGLSRYVPENDMLQIIQRSTNLDDTCSELIEAAKIAKSDDNITCVLVRAVEKSWTEHVFSKLMTSPNAHKKST